MKPVRIGILGLGTVGSGVIETLIKEESFFQFKLGLTIELTGICAKSKATLDKFDMPIAIKTQNAAELCTSPDIDVIIELIGGYDAKHWVTLALKNKKHVITANKAMLAKHGQELFPLAAENNCFLLFEAAVGGGIPIINAISDGFIANEITGLACIINGTCNYILTEMAQKGLEFNDVLESAKELGYAEADPTMDIDGTDSAQKLALLASLAYWKYVNFEEMHVEGIQNISREDVSTAKEFGYSIKLLGTISFTKDNQISANVYPALLKKQHQLANVNGVLNAVYIKASAAGESLLTGAGAGKLPTASAVVSDLVSVCRFLKSKGQDVPSQEFFVPENKLELADIGSLETEYYLRLTTTDEPGVLAKITSILADNNISINSIVQKPNGEGDSVTVILLTHKAKDQNIKDAVTSIDDLVVVKAKSQLIRFYS